MQRTKDETRIYVFVGRRDYLVKFMNQMSVEQLFDEGKYMVVYLSPETANKDELGYLLWDIEGNQQSMNMFFIDVQCHIN